MQAYVPHAFVDAKDKLLEFHNASMMPGLGVEVDLWHPCAAPWMTGKSCGWEAFWLGSLLAGKPSLQK